MANSDAVFSLLKKKGYIKDGIVDGYSKQHGKKKLTARERVGVLLDEGSFQEFGIFIKHRSTNFGLDGKELPCDGVITGYGTIFGRPVFVYSQDFSVAGGSLGEMHAKKITVLQKKALEMRCPIIGINDSGGARIQEGIDALNGYGEIFQNNIDASGVIPQISVIMGPCAGGAAYSPALTDFTIMSRGTSYMFITGPNVVKTTTGEDVSFEELGGASSHTHISGVADLAFDNDVETLLEVRRLISFLPLSNTDTNKRTISKIPSVVPDCKILNTIIPESNLTPYDMKDVISNIVDNGDFFEIQPDYAKNIIICFGRIFGSTIGIVANQPMEIAGCIDIKASRKAARFVRFCDAFNIPIISLVDVPGFLPGKDQEHGAIIRHGAKLLYAYGEATVPKISIVLRKSYGGSYIVMGAKSMTNDLNYAWPNAEIAVLGGKQAGEILFRKHCKTDEEYNSKIQEYEEKFCNPYYAASRGYIDDVIEPSKTREIIHRGLEILAHKKSQKPWKKHDNLPM